MSTLKKHKHNIVIGMSGSIACYKTCEIIRLLSDEALNNQFTIRVVMTAAAIQFITPLTMAALSRNPVSTALLDPEAEAAMGHIELARWADLIVIAPTSANLIAKLANGFADDILTTLCLATKAPIMLAPAMNTVMWENPATVANVQQLKSRHFYLIGPDKGNQACGETGEGRLMPPHQIAQQVVQFFSNSSITDTYPHITVEPTQAADNHQAEQHWVITAGPTQEALDPVRYLGNHSSGKMGFALAAEAAKLLKKHGINGRITLIAGPCQLDTPCGDIERIDVISCDDMHAKVKSLLDDKGVTVFISSAAVSDFKPSTVSPQKIKKTESETMELKLIRNPDILSMAGRHDSTPFIVGFAAETKDTLNSATNKLYKKNCDLMVANEISKLNPVFGSSYNSVIMIEPSGQVKHVKGTKIEIAEHICNHIIALLPDTISK